MPHTAHLPLYCSFDIVEMDLQPPYVTTTALKCFSGKLLSYYYLPTEPSHKLTLRSELRHSAKSVFKVMDFKNLEQLRIIC